MKYLTEYRDREKAMALAASISELAPVHPVTLMEVCGTHTMSIARFGIKSILPKNIDLISGPGCPVCVTPNSYVDHAIALSRKKNLVICTFGDMMKVPGSTSSLAREHMNGADVRMVYSTIDALEIAKQNPQLEIVFLGVGFETTSPTIAASIDIADRSSLKNYSVLSSNKVVPPALEALMSGGPKLDGFLLPGHVSTIIGIKGYSDFASKHSVAMAIAGFEPLDILGAICEIVQQISLGKEMLANSYGRAVSAEGNPRAIEMLEKIFEPCDAAWRGIGVIPESGLKIREEYSRFDAAKKFSVAIEETREHPGCICGSILRGIARPDQCPLFGKNCTPEDPVGSCMVSSEGTCAAAFKYGAI